MTDEILNMIRRAIERGHDNSTILDMLDIAGVAADSTARPVGRASVQTTRGSKTPFRKPDTTRTMYRAVLRGPARTWASQLDKLGVTGNQRAVIDFVIKNGGEADSRELRRHVLRHKLDPETGTNKAIESAVHALKTRKPALLRAEEKPNGGYASDTGIPLDDE